MNRHPLDLALVTVAIASLAAATWRWSASDLDVPAPVLPRASMHATPVGPVSDALAVTAGIVAQDPFRLSNRPSRVRLGDDAVPEAAPPPRYRPLLVLKGIVGPPWVAVIGGIPGVRGDQLLGAGDKRDSLTVREVNADRVVLVGPDTVWVLTLKGGRP